MTDKELLELAAKAAGIEAHYTKYHEFWFDDGSKPWNPLINDADALRLAVKLEIWPMPSELCGEARVSLSNQHEEIVTVWLSEVGDDPYAATRRAIVRAAAEIGREKK